MNVVVALIVGAVVFLLTVESVYDPRRTANHVNKYRAHPHSNLSFGKYSNNKFKEKNKNNSAALDYDNDKQKRFKRSINKRLADRFARQKISENDLDMQKLFKLDGSHKIRHHHDRNLDDFERQKLQLRSRIAFDGRKDIDRRKRYTYVTKDGVVHYTYNPTVACNGWAYYSPYACVYCGCQNEACLKPCKNAGPSTHPPYIHRPTSKPAPPIYSGPGKNWIGPKLGCSSFVAEDRLRIPVYKVKINFLRAAVIPVGIVPGCNCNPRGSELSTCDITTGQCRCKPFYVGRTCEKCQDGYWERGNQCIKCDCDIDGSKSNICDQKTGQCDCKPGVQGFRCGACLPRHFGFSALGCKACDPCDKKGHVCDPNTGHCICPPYSYGESCHLCSPNTWGYEPDKGCKLCECSSSGSMTMQCDLHTGECNCRLGYTGVYCDQCAHGYFGYPKCRRCNCKFAGSDKYLAKCDNTGVCQCNPDGRCPCKANVAGKKCDKCIDGTFGLHLENPEGCTKCFCFGRSAQCSESGLTWGKIRINSSRILTVNRENYDDFHPARDVEVSDKLLVIPGVHGNTTVHNYHFDSPLYWKLHHAFNGDRILSYGGYLSFVSHTHNSRQRFPQEVINHYPLVQLRGHGKITLEYYPPLASTNNRHEVRFHESLWKRIYPKDTHLLPRELFMITLQSVQNIFIKASDSSDFDSLILQDVILDSAIEVPGGNPLPVAEGVEICECPEGYNSSSCQDPSIGFFRDYTPSSSNGTILIDTFIGHSKPCQCNGRSKICNAEDGFCLNCSGNTGGRYCDKCAEGFYGNPMIPFGICEPCPCPLPSQNFAKECTPLHKHNQFICTCREGYMGTKCDQCSYGYYGRPQIPGGSCQPCNCNDEGKASDECDSETGQCNCRPGVTGKQCSQCEKPRHVLEKSECTPCDTCSQWLLNDIDKLSNDLQESVHFLLNGTVQPPWKKLNELELRYGHLHDKYASLSESKTYVNDLLESHNVTILENRLSDLKNSLHSKNPDVVIDQGRNVVETAEGILKSVRDDKYRLQTLIKTLENFGKSQVDTKEAVKRGKHLLREIKTIEKNILIPNDTVFKRCKAVTSLIERMLEEPSVDIDIFKNQLINLQDRLEDLETVAVQAEITNDRAEILNRGNEYDLVALKEKLNIIKEMNKSVSDDLTQINITLNNTSIALAKLQNLVTLLNDSEFNTLTEKLNKHIAEISEFDVRKQLDEVWMHVRYLEKNATEYERLFNLSNKEINAIKASEAYKNIKKLLDEAEELATKAYSDVHAALDTLSPEGKDSIAINTSISLADSERLEIRIKHQRENLAAIKQKKDNLALQLTTLDANNWANGLKNRDQDNALTMMKNNISKINREQMEAVIKDAIDQTDKIKSIHRQLMDISIVKQSEIEKPLQRLQNLLTTDKLDKLREQLEVTKETLAHVFQRNQTYMDIIEESKKKYNVFKNMNNTVGGKLNELKARIDNAKKTADRIRISLSGPTCLRSYLLNDLAPSLSTKLVITFNYSSNSDSKIISSLFKLTTSTNQFINLTIERDILQFEWKLGQEINQLVFENSLVHNSFYTVEVDRIGNSAEMTVNKVKVSKMSEHENETAILRADPTDLVYVGPGLSGCLRDIFYDNHRIGLWNFQTTAGDCLGCIRSNDLTIENTYDFYKGDGYAEISKEYQERYAKPGEFNVQFSLRTFDENALLFLAPDPERKNYIAVTLKDGYIQYEIHYANHDDIVLKSKDKFNTGEKVKISAEKVWKKNLRQDIAVLKINDEVVSSETRNSIDSSAILRLKKVNYYFGGVPRDYLSKSNSVSSNLHTHASLLGGLDDLKEYLLFNDDSIKKYGVGRQGGELEYQQVWFEGNGFVELQASKIKKKMGFLLKTKELNCFVMLVNNITLLNIANGKISITLEFSNKKTLKSNEIINDNQYHLIELATSGKTATLSVNGLLQDSIQYENLMEIDMQDDTIYLGGGKPIEQIFGGQNLFSGVISEIVIDNNFIKFNKDTIKSFEKAKIGRNGLSKTVRIRKITPKSLGPDNNPSNIKEMQNTESCGKSQNYTFDPNAAKFGDKPHSHVLHYLKDNFWRKDYTIEIQFRTLQPNGLLFLSFGPKQQFNLLEVKNGKLNFKANGKRMREVMLPQKIDDGNWYTIIVDVSGLKKKRKLTLAINGFKTKPIRPPRNKLFREFYIGGVSPNTTVPSIIRNTLLPFKGCVRGLKLNKKPQTIIRDKSTIHYNIGQCFPHIEKGSYFGGDAYAIYSKLFHIDQTLELSLEFRTSEQNGILLSVSNPRNSPALAVELQNGAIVMTTDNGYGTVTNVTNNLSDFALCNNQWHNVTAVYTNTEITINVDGIRKIWVQPTEETLMDELEAPLYIGGIPDYAPVGTLKMKENFKGCIKNIKIGETAVDWFRMEKISNILLDSCPTIQNSREERRRTLTAKEALNELHHFKQYKSLF